MKGYRTLITNVVLGGVALLLILGYDVKPELEEALLKGALALGALLNIWLRLNTDGPVPRPKALDPEPKKRRTKKGPRGSLKLDVIPVLLFIGVISLLLVMQTGCSSSAIKDNAVVTPFEECINGDGYNNARLASCATSIEILATAADTAADNGVISGDTEKALLDKLETALAMLEGVRDSRDGGRLAIIQRLLVDVAAELPQ